MRDFWVFGYGSLIWRPGFAHIEAHRARLYGYRRTLCIYSEIYRGTVERPGLVLGLDSGGSCLGMAFRIAEDAADDVLDYLRKRELITNVYLEKWLSIVLDDGRKVEAVVYVADRYHSQYAGALTGERAADIVAHAVGEAGPNVDYVASTVAHLRQMRVRDQQLEHICDLVAAAKDQAATSSV